VKQIHSDFRGYVALFTGHNCMGVGLLPS